MPTVVKMPQLGESVIEGTVARWLKAPGDPVTKLEPLLEITTDKIDTEIPAPADGTLLEILVPEGETVRAGASLAYIGEPNGEHEIQDTGYGKRETEVESAADGKSQNQPTSPHSERRGAVQAPHSERPAGRGFVSPVVGRIAAEHGIDLDQVEGTGLHGRVTKKDVLAFVAQRSRMVDASEIGEIGEIGRPAQIPPISPISQSPAAAEEATPAPAELAPDEVLEPLSAIRRAIAAHMVQSKQSSPHVTTVFEVDMTAVVRHREEHKRSFADRGIKLTFTPYFVAATAAALRQAPQVNSRFSDRGIVLNRRIHIGVAVALNDGLIVPVIRDADEKNLPGLARAVNELAERARSGRLGPDDVKGGTFTITNHGVSGSLIGTPIINQPQSGILGIGAIVKRPVVRSTQQRSERSTQQRNERSTQQRSERSSSRSLLPSADDAIVIRPMCYLSFTFDHRVLDGAQADAFLTVVRDRLENWENAEH
jgi:2-oxoglutarate dehydrogenase E2 component (dihydrolipoamide succinyltransferase)